MGKKKKSSNSVKVYIRCRPINALEKKKGCSECVQVNEKEICLEEVETKQKTRFTFDSCFGQEDGQESLHEKFGKGLLEKALEAYNVCIFAYGQTSSGKSHSMFGTKSDPGLIPRLCSDLFKAIDEHEDKDVVWTVSTSMMEIYNETIRDLKVLDRQEELTVREHPITGCFVPGLASVVVQSSDEILRELALGMKARTIETTTMNRCSSRSHTIFEIKIKQEKITIIKDKEYKSQKVSKINLIDLAGSERSKKTGAEGLRLKEGNLINLSLTTLGRVISALSKAKKVIPYRDSILTRLLTDSLGGNSVTVMLATISPSSYNYFETKSTLEYAHRAKNIKNKAKVNSKSGVIQTLKKEIETLKLELERANQNQGSQEEISALQQQLQDSKMIIDEMQMSLEEKLTETKAILENRDKALEKTGLSLANLHSALGVDIANYPFIINLDEDSTLTENLMYFFKDGITKLGSDPENDITLVNLNPFHCEIVYQDNDDIRIRPIDGASICVNGKEIHEEKLLTNSDRLYIGGRHIFKFQNPNSKVPKSTTNVVDWEFAHQERMEELRKEFEERKQAQEEELKQVSEKLEKMKELKQEEELDREKEIAMFKKKIEKERLKMEELLNRNQSIQKDLNEKREKTERLNDVHTIQLQEMEENQLSLKSQIESQTKRQVELEEIISSMEDDSPEKSVRLEELEKVTVDIQSIQKEFEAGEALVEEKKLEIEENETDQQYMASSIQEAQRNELKLQSKLEDIAKRQELKLKKIQEELENERSNKDTLVQRLELVESEKASEIEMRRKLEKEIQELKEKLVKEKNQPTDEDTLDDSDEGDNSDDENLPSNEQNSVNVETTEELETNQNVETTEEIENDQDVESMEETENDQNVQTTEETETNQTNQNAETTEEMENDQNVQTTEEIENNQNIENTSTEDKRNVDDEYDGLSGNDKPVSEAIDSENQISLETEQSQASVVPEPNHESEVVDNKENSNQTGVNAENEANHETLENPQAPNEAQQDPNVSTTNTQALSNEDNEMDINVIKAEKNRLEKLLEEAREEKRRKSILLSQETEKIKSLQQLLQSKGSDLAKGHESNERGNVVCEGWMTKLGSKFPSWKTRWFQLFSNGELIYFKNPKSKSLGKIEIQNSTFSQSKKKKNCILIQSGKRKFHFYAKDAQSLEAWIAPLERCGSKNCFPSATTTNSTVEK